MPVAPARPLPGPGPRPRPAGHALSLTATPRLMRVLPAFAQGRPPVATPVMMGSSPGTFIYLATLYPDESR